MGLIIFTILIALVFWLFKRFIVNDDSLEARGIVHPKPLPIVGNMLPLLLQKEGGINFFERVYKMFPNEK